MRFLSPVTRAWQCGYNAIAGPISEIYQRHYVDPLLRRAGHYNAIYEKNKADSADPDPAKFWTRTRADGAARIATAQEIYSRALAENDGSHFRALTETTSYHAAAAWKWITRPDVLRGPGENGKPGKIIGPPSQYILSAINNNTHPFTVFTLLFKIAPFVLILATMVRTGANTMGDLAALYTESIFDAAMDALTGKGLHIPDAFKGSLSLPTCRDDNVTLETVGTTCYVKGGNKILTARFDPHVDRIFDFDAGSIHFNGFDRQMTGDFFALIIVLLSCSLMMSQYRWPLRPGEHDPLPFWPKLNFSPQFKFKPNALGWQSIIFALIVWYQTISVNAGFFGLGEHPDANSIVWDHWLNWDWRGPNWDRIVAYWGSWSLLVLIVGPMMTASLNAANVAHTKFARVYQRILDSILDSNFGHSLKNRELSNWFIQLARSLFTPVEAGPLRNQSNGDLILDPKTGEPFIFPDYIRVNQEIRSNSPAEAAAITRGEHNPRLSHAGRIVSDASVALLAAGVMGMGAASLADMVLKTEISPLVADNPIVDGAAVAAAGILGSMILAAGMYPEGRARHILGILRSVMVSLFIPSRAGFWFGSYLVIATSANAANATLSQVLQGYQITPLIMMMILYNSLLGGAWANRIVGGTYNALTGKNGSKYWFLFPSYFVAGWFGAMGWAPQTISQFHTPTAVRFALTNEPAEKDALAGSMESWRQSLLDALAETRDPKKFEEIRQELVRIRSADMQFVIPNLEPTDPKREQLIKLWTELNDLLLVLPSLGQQDPRREEIEAHFASKGFALFQTD